MNTRTISRNVLGTMILVLAAAALIAAQQTGNPWEGVNRAVCAIIPTQGNEVRGSVEFTQNGGKVRIHAHVSGLNPNQKHAIHIHEFGDITCADGLCAGGHYNPQKKPHGLPPAAERHAGDLGNLQADAQGNAHFELEVDNISIAGAKNPIIGRGLIIHAQPDDGGQPVGNAGARLGYGVIGIATPANN